MYIKTGILSSFSSFLAHPQIQGRIVILSKSVRSLHRGSTPMETFPGRNPSLSGCKYGSGTSQCRPSWGPLLTGARRFPCRGLRQYYQLRRETSSNRTSSRLTRHRHQQSGTFVLINTSDLSISRRSSV